MVAEMYRLFLLRGLENALGQMGYGAIAGVDEAGRGALAGPVVSAAVILPTGVLIPGVDDSKVLNAPKREKIAALIKKKAIAWRIEKASSEEIDQTDILRAVKRTMGVALSRLNPEPDYALVDAVRLPTESFPVLSTVRGDALSYSIAAASILAKTYRDAWMTDLNRRYPHYGFDRHFGYGVAAHRKALKEYGPCPEHRLTYKSVIPRLSARAA